MLSADDRALMERDPALPGLSTLLDVDAFTAWLTATPSANAAEHPQGARALYVRYKRGVSCIVLFDVAWPTHSAFVTATCYHPLATDKVAKARAFAAEQPAIPSWIDDAQAITAYAFPADRELPVLRRLHNAESRSRILHKLFGDSVHDARMTTVLRYKPERRFASVWTIDGKSVVVKAYAEGEYARALANAQSARATTPAPIAASERHRLIAWAWLEGAACTPADLPACAIALAKLHQSGTRLSQHAAPELIGAWAAGAAAAIADLDLDLGLLANDIAGEVQRHTKNTHSAVPLHGDCSLDQCIRTPLGVTLIDFDNALMGPPMLDLGNLAAKCLLSTGDRASIHTLLDAYARASPNVSRSGAPVFIALGILRAATDAFRRRQVQWVLHTRTALEHAHEVLHAC